MSGDTIGKILVPLDFSASSHNALKTAVAIGRQSGASLTLMHVLEHSKIPIRAGQEAAASLLQLTEIATENLDRLCQGLSLKYNMEVTYILEPGIASDVICKHARNHSVDMIILGTTGRVGLRRILMGSTTYRVVKKSPCPVMSVPATRSFIRFKRIVFPVRNAPNMVDKYFTVRPIVNNSESEILLAGLTKANDVKSYKGVVTTMEDIAKKFLRDRIKFTSELHVCSSASSQLLEISRRQNPDLIVITAAVTSSLKNCFLDYYAMHVMNHAPCPVLSIRAKIVSD